MSEPAADDPGDDAAGPTTRARLAIAVVAVAGLVGAFLVLPGGGDAEPAGTGSQPARTAADGGATSGSTGAAPAPAARAPVVPVVRVRGGKPVAGVRRITVQKGDRIRFS